MGPLGGAEDGAGRLDRVPRSAVLGKERKADIDILEAGAFDKSAHPDRRSPILCLNGVQTKSVLAIACYRSSVYVGHCVRDATYATVADILYPIGVV